MESLDIFIFYFLSHPSFKLKYKGSLVDTLKITRFKFTFISISKNFFVHLRDYLCKTNLIMKKFPSCQGRCYPILKRPDSVT